MDRTKVAGKVGRAILVHVTTRSRASADVSMDELEELYFTEDFDEEKFLAGGREMLDGVEAFWVGLNEHRIAHEFQTA